MDDHRAVLDAASYGRTALSRETLLSDARVNYNDSKAKCCAEDKSQPRANSVLSGHLPAD
jgi:hypothetical protein